MLPFHYSDYAAAVAAYVTELQQVQDETPGAAQVDLQILLDGRAGLGRGRRPAGGARRRAAAGGRHRVARREPRDRPHQPRADAPGAGAHSTREGLPGRPWFRHQVYAPGLVTGYAVQYLPGMRDAIEQGDEQTAQTYRDLLLDSLLEAARLADAGAR